MYVAGDPSLGLVLLTCLGGALSAGGAGAINHAVDRDIDRTMARTATRPVAARPHLPGRRDRLRRRCSGSPPSPLLALTVNPLAAAPLALSGLLGYVFVYTLWLKRSTPQNIVIGGAAGAVPPLVAWAAVTGGLSGTAFYLFAIVFFWTPPHFWALSLLMKDEYAKAGVPMLPVVRGEARDPAPDPPLHGPALRGDPAALLRRRLRRRVPGRLDGARRRLHLLRRAAAAQRRPPLGAAHLPLLARLPGAALPRCRSTPALTEPPSGRNPPVDRETARRNMTAGLVAGGIAAGVFALSFVVAVLYIAS